MQQLGSSLQYKTVESCSSSPPLTMQAAPGSFFLDLPPSLLQQILALCAPAQLARCACTCKHLYKVSAESSAWVKHCHARWAMWASGRWSIMQEQGAWKSLYAARHAVCKRKQFVLEFEHCWRMFACEASSSRDGFAYIDGSSDKPASVTPGLANQALRAYFTAGRHWI